MLATVAEERSGQECSTSAPAGRRLGLEVSRVKPMRRAASTPTLHSMSAPIGGENAGLEVYVVLRCFKEFGGGLFRRLPPSVRDGCRDMGICHYQVAFRQRDGTLVQFDFGPKGGDIHVARGPFAAVLNKNCRAGPSAARSAATTGGEVREERLSQLPEAHMYVGRTPLNMADIRAWNTLQEQEYELHRNDCRHFVNSLVAYSTGLQHASSKTLRHQWSRGHVEGSYGLASRMVQLGQMFTDVANWGRVKALGQASLATMMAVTGRRAVGVVGPAMVGIKGASTKLLPAAGARLIPVRHALVRKPVMTMGTAAVATLAASGSQAPGVQEAVTLGARVAGGVHTAVRAAATLVEHVGRRASQATLATSQQAVAMASNIASAARGAGGTVAARQRHMQAGGSPVRIRLPTLAAGERSQRLALAVTTVARR